MKRFNAFVAEDTASTVMAVYQAVMIGVPIALIAAIGLSDAVSNWKYARTQEKRSWLEKKMREASPSEIKKWERKIEALRRSPDWMKPSERMARAQMMAQVKSTTESFDPFKVFSPKRTTNEPDGEYGIRALVRYTSVLPKSNDWSGGTTVVNALFPPTQLKTTDNKYDFNRHLNSYVNDLKSRGHEILGIHLKGSPEFDKFTGSRRKV